MKRLYVFVHVLVILPAVVVTQFAFLLFLPAYVIAMIVGFDMYGRNSKETRRIARAIHAAVLQTVCFIAIAAIEWGLFAWLVDIPRPEYQLVLISALISLGAFSGVFLLVEVVRTRNAKSKVADNGQDRL